MTIQKKLFVSHFLVVLLVIVGAGGYFYFSVVQHLTEKLRDQLSLFAGAVTTCVDVDELDAIQNLHDTKRLEYRDCLRRLREFKHINRIAVLHVLRQKGDTLTCVLDADETNRQILPGQEYKASRPEIYNGFSQLVVDKQIWSHPQWGAFLSGYVPLGSSDGNYMIRLDIRADDVKARIKSIQISGAFSLGGSILLALLFSRGLSKTLVGPIKLLISRCSDVAEGQLDQKLDVHTKDELHDLAEAFNTMSSHLATSRDQRDVAELELKKTLDELEERVIERTKDLKAANDKLLIEIAERKRAEKALEEAARTDALTGLLNRRAMLERMNAEIDRFHRNQVSFTLILGDIDFFKSVNDTYGHPEGDRIIKLIANALRSGVRSVDMVARWGGEEFLLMLPDTGLAGGSEVAEKLRKSIYGNIWPTGHEEKLVSMSLGVSVFDGSGHLEDCIKQADEALYEAKESGRNRVVCAS